MGLTIKGFVTNHAKVSNEIAEGRGVVSKFGELSPDAKTYAKELGYYYYPNTPYGLTTFTCIDDYGKTSLNISQQKLIGDVINWVYTLGRRMTPPTTYAEFIYKFNNDFAAKKISNIELGEIDSDGELNLPGFIGFVVDNKDYYKLWFSDESFRLLYDEYEIDIITPTNIVDDLWLSFNDVKLKLEDQNNPVILTQKIQETKNGFPFTHIETQILSIVNTRNKSEKINSYWTAIVYGNAGANYDAIRHAMIEYALANSRFSYEDWVGLIPELFRRSEFYLMPLWKNIAIETTAVADKGITSPISNIKKAMTALTELAKEYPANHVAEHAEVFVHSYKPMSIYSIAHPETLDKKFSLKDWYKDYIPAINTANLDFGRMSDVTREWAILINDLLYAAETYHPRKVIDRRFSVLKRFDKTYLCVTHNRLKFLVYAKINEVEVS